MEHYDDNTTLILSYFDGEKFIPPNHQEVPAVDMSKWSSSRLRLLHKNISARQFQWYWTHVHDIVQSRWIQIRTGNGTNPTTFRYTDHNLSEIKRPCTLVDKKKSVVQKHIEVISTYRAQHGDSGATLGDKEYVSEHGTYIAYYKEQQFCVRSTAYTQERRMYNLKKSDEYKGHIWAGDHTILLFLNVGKKQGMCVVLEVVVQEDSTHVFEIQFIRYYDLSSITSTAHPHGE